MLEKVLVAVISALRRKIGAIVVLYCPWKMD
jgi:hypothetical protein